MSDIFVSYSQGDRDWVAQFASSLEAEGFSVWWDPNILPGSRFREIVKTELAEAHAVIVVWSHLSVSSDWVLGEADEARQLRKLIPVLRENVRPPHEFRVIQTADLSQWRGKSRNPEFRKVVSAVRNLVPSPAPAQTSPPPPTPKQPVAPVSRERQGSMGNIWIRILLMVAALSNLSFIVNNERRPSVAVLSAVWIALDLTRLALFGWLAIRRNTNVALGIRIISVLGVFDFAASVANFTAIRDVTSLTDWMMLPVYALLSGLFAVVAIANTSEAARRSRLFLAAGLVFVMAAQVWPTVQDASYMAALDWLTLLASFLITAVFFLAAWFAPRYLPSRK
jgi:hypothetical protein